jgi:SWI/SNF-related matrix-associated actin-dependent regulator of chromatin subfamily A3
VLIGDSQYIRLKLLLKNNCHFLCFDFSDVGIAVLDTRTSAVLQRIETICPTQFYVFKDESPAPSIDQQGDQSFSRQHILHLAIDIYSPRRFAEAIGKELSKVHFYLQHPYRLDKSRLYENPHEFKSKRQTPGYIPGKPELLSQQSLPYIQAPTADLPKEERQASLVEQLLQTQVQNQTIQQSDPDSRITTNLLLHQKQALYFILQRERGIINSGLSLWKTEGTEHRPYYRHSIHDFRTAKLPEDNRGGLLADEMGLGKTLSLISAIVTSLDDAKTYSCLHQQKNRVDAGRKSRATLVIAPSTGLKSPPSELSHI